MMTAIALLARKALLAQKALLAAAVALLAISSAPADDIDVYVAPPPEATVGETMVVFTLDVRPNVMASEVCTNGECDDLFAEVGMLVDEDGDGSHDNSISFFEMLVAALKKVLRDIDSHKVKVALMIPHADSTGGNKQCVGFQGNNVVPDCSNGAYVLSAFKSTGDNPDTVEDESLELDQFFRKMESIPLKDGGNWVHQYQMKELFFEMFRYVSAGRVFNGVNGLDNFGTGNVNQCNIDDDGDTESVYAGGTSVTGAEIPPDNEVVPDDYYCPVDGDTPTIENPINELSWDSAALRTDNDQNLKFYKDTLEVAEHCTQIFSVNVTFANASQDSDSDATGISLAEPDGFGFDPADNDRGRLQVLEYLHGVDLSESLVGKQNITSYFVTVPGGRAAQANDWARAGGSGSAIVVEEDPEELVRKLGGLFSEIQGVSTSFVSASVPANVFNRAEVLNEVLLAIFEPDEDNAPFWVGNVKKLKTRKIQEQVYEDLDGDGEDEPVYADLDGDGDEEPVTEERKILVDVLEEDTADPTSAINPLDGRIRKGALTFWTRTGSNNEYLPPPDPSIQEDELEFIEGTDGRKVDRGGAGQVKPGYLGSGSPGHTNNTLSDTTMSGPRKLLTEPETSTDGTPDPMLHLDAAALDSTLADELLTDGRTYPGSDLSYGDYLFQTVMDDCADCGTSYNDGTTTTTQQETAVRRVSNLIRFARGWDVDLDTALSADIDDTGKRAWWQADPLHSRPIAVNYGVRTADFTEERPDVRVIVSGNDGMVQMIRDGRLADGSEDGIEAWAFLPREFVPLQKRLLEGTLGVYNPGIPDPDGHEPLHPYAMDGSPTVLRIDNDLDGTIDTGAGDRVYLFIGQRRGGKRYYALDISDPDQPKLMWSIGKDDADGELAELAQSWSLMRAGVMAVDESGTVKNRPVLIFTGGYNGDDGGDGAGDLGKDSRVPNRAGADGNMGTSDDEIVGTDDQEGNALFIINGLTGELIWRAAGPPTADAEALADPAYDDTSLTLQHPDLVDSVASTPAVLDADGDGFIERVYFPDTGGNVWRMDAHSPDRSTWTVNKLFEGGRHFQDDGANDRRFFHKPDVVLAADEDGKFDAVIVTSGDRARPLATDVENWVYMIKDRADYGVSQPSPITHSDLADLTDNCLQDQQLDNLDLTSCDDGSAGSNLVNGWKVQLRQCEAQGADPSDHCGEKGLAEPVTLEGTIFFTTYLPVIDTIVSDTPSTCGTQEGAGLLYGLDLQTAGGVLDFDPSNNAGGVQVADRFVRLGTPGIPPNVVPISGNEILPPDLEIRKVPGRKSRETFWYDRRFN